MLSVMLGLVIVVVMLGALRDATPAQQREDAAAWSQVPHPASRRPAVVLFAVVIVLGVVASAMGIIDIGPWLEDMDHSLRVVLR